MAVFLLAAVAAVEAVKMDSKAADMSTTQLLEMKNKLQHKLEMNQRPDSEEKRIFIYFKEMIENVSIPRLLNSSRLADSTIINAWNVVIECSNQLETARTDTWGNRARDFYTARYVHNECRNNQSTSISACVGCKAFVDGWVSPPADQLTDDRTPVMHNTHTAAQTGAVFGTPNTYVGIKNWFEQYNSWHCPEVECPGNNGWGTRKECLNLCNQDCAQQIQDNHNSAENCSTWETGFEHSVCDWRLDVSLTCNDFKTCKNQSDVTYGNIVDTETKLLESRIVEYRIMKTILCFIDLLTSEARPTRQQRLDCQQDWPIDDLQLYYPHIQYQDVNTTTYIPGSDDCTCTEYPAGPNGCLTTEVHENYTTMSAPCDAGFEATHYHPQQWWVDGIQFDVECEVCAV